MNNQTTPKKLKSLSVRSLTVTALFAAVATVLMYLDVALPFLPSFLKFDLSDFPALLVSFALSPWYGLAVCFLKNLLHLFVSSSMWVGELINFALGAFFVVPAGLIYHHHKTRRTALAASLIGTATMGGLGMCFNYFVGYPLYISVYGWSMEMILGTYQEILPSVNNLWIALLIFNLPLTVVKGIFCSLIVFLIYKPLSPVMKGKRI